jgi:hypothetical protein
MPGPRNGKPEYPSLLDHEGIREYMTQTKSNAPRSAQRRAKTALALLTATAALAAGAEALAPTPAAAMINLGNDCANLSGWALFECEMHGAGAGGSGAGGAGNTNGDAGSIELDPEVIRIDGTPPPACMVDPWKCMPSMPGGRHQIGADGVRPRGPRPGGHRPIRVGEVVKGKSIPPSRKSCMDYIKGGPVPRDGTLAAAFLQIEDEERRLEEHRKELQAVSERWFAWLRKGQALSRELEALRAQPKPDLGRILAIQRELSKVLPGMRAVEAEPLYAAYVRTRKRSLTALDAIEKECRNVYDLNNPPPRSN